MIFHHNSQLLFSKTLEVNLLIELGSFEKDESAKTVLTFIARFFNPRSFSKTSPQFAPTPACLARFKYIYIA